ncbi:MAG TPA: thermonuclease family protein [Gammaproteobacteria bacterium]|nr:thermonuclease family protein [Gammaproteobacteria bacterium]
MRSIVTIFVVVFTVVLNSISVVNSQEGGGVAFEAPPGQSPIQAEELPMDLIEDYEDDTLVDKKFLDKAQKKKLDFNIVGKARVIDGDTITINNAKIRFSGIDAPEKNYYGQTQFCKGPKGVWACGKKASTKLKQLINGQEVQCTDEGKDRYGRTLSICYANGVDLQAEMVRSGMAVAYLRYSNRYENEMVEAMVAQVGIWGGPFVEPEQWRIQNRKK